MEDRNTAMIVLLLLCVTAEMQVDGLSLDVCASCHAKATCDDKSDGSGKVCNCKYGFVGNGRSYCQDKDECQIGASKICGLHTDCHNTQGSYFCTCLSGFTPSNNMDVFTPNDGTHCQDIDECTVTGLCGEGGQCRNLEGSFDCRCILGYEVQNGAEPFQPHRDKASCNVVDCDIDECTVTGLCGEGGQCRNLEGSFDCRCILGYEVQNGAEPFHPHRDKASCKVVDCGHPEAAEDTVLLSVSGTTYGSAAMFVCEEGFVWRRGNNRSVCEDDGLWRGGNMSCEEVECGVPAQIPHSEMLWDKSSSVGSLVVYQCVSGYGNVGQENASVCTARGEWEGASLQCEEIRCGEPVLKAHAAMLWDGSSHVGSVVSYRCEEGFHSRGLGNSSLCGEEGEWEDPDLWCEEISCGRPPTLPHTHLLWDGSQSLGSVRLYGCKEGFYQEGGNNMSTCLLSGEWGEVSMKCKAKCGPAPVLHHSEVVWHNRSVVVHRCEEGYHSWRGSNVSECESSGEWRSATLSCIAKCGPAPVLHHSEVVWHNRSVVVHRCEEGYHSWRGSNVSECESSGEWRSATLSCIEIKPPVNHLRVLNEKCVQWRAEKYEEHTETYKVTYTGSRDYQRSFQDKRKRFLSSNADELQLCLNLLPVTNYSISITAASSRFTASITTNTSLTVPPALAVDYREFETPVPTLRLRRSPNTLDPISVYQVFVLPVDGNIMFDCSSPASSDPKSKSSAEYITGEFDVQHVGTEMNFTVGDGLLYGGFFNAPLQNGRSYYIILRAVSQWKSAFKSSCVVWARVTGTSYVLRVSSLSAVAAVGLVVFVIIGGYSFC
ncbi:hypothetical protein JOQ06_012034, partial [Pogonophryne albipinna]